MPKPPLQWNRFQNNLSAVIGNSAVAGGTITPAYGAVMFGDGLYLASYTGSANYVYLEFPFNASGVIECYVKAGSSWSYNSTTKACSDGKDHLIMGFNTGAATRPLIALQVVNGLGWNFNILDQSSRQKDQFFNGASISANEVFHFAWTWDATTFSAWKNGSKMTTDWSCGSVAFNGSTGRVGLLQHGYLDRGADIYMDNTKVYDYTKTDFSDRFRERGGMNDHISSM
jgi:hypothetical protein